MLLRSQRLNLWMRLILLIREWLLISPPRYVLKPPAGQWSCKQTADFRFFQAILTPVPNLKVGIVYSEDGSDTIESGSLDELIHEFVPRAHFVPPEDYQFTFLLASRYKILRSLILKNNVKKARN